MIQSQMGGAYAERYPSEGYTGGEVYAGLGENGLVMYPESDIMVAKEPMIADVTQLAPGEYYGYVEDEFEGAPEDPGAPTVVDQVQAWMGVAKDFAQVVSPFVTPFIAPLAAGPAMAIPSPNMQVAMLAQQTEALQRQQAAATAAARGVDVTRMQAAARAITEAGKPGIMTMIEENWWILALVALGGFLFIK